MGLWRILKSRLVPVLISVSLRVLPWLTGGGLFGPAQDGVAAPLDAARMALRVGDLTLARAEYSRITPQDPAWSGKLRDLLVWHLREGRSDEAWRLGALAARTVVALPDRFYLRTLAALGQGQCDTSHETGHPLWNLLVKAHIMRYFGRFPVAEKGGSSIDTASRSMLPTYLGAEQEPLLSEIPRLRLLKGAGCGDLLDGVVTADLAAAAELAALTAWFEHRDRDPRETVDIPGADGVLLRLGWLSLEAHKKDPMLKGKTANPPAETLSPHRERAAQVLRILGQRSVERWLELPEGEQRFLFALLRESGFFSQEPIAPDSREGTLVRALILSAREPEASRWLHTLDAKKWPDGALEPLVDHLLAVERIEYRPYLLLWKARIRHRAGDAPVTLGILRRLLLGGAGAGEGGREGVGDEVDDTVQGGAMALAIALFTEYRYDEAMLGAIQNSIPVSEWRRLFRALAIDHALRGDGSRFSQVVALLRLHKGGQGALARELPVLEAMAKRSHRAFTRSLAALHSQRRSSSSFVNFVSALAGRSLGLSSAERSVIRPYLLEMDRYLRMAVTKGAQDPRILELSALLGSTDASAFEQGRDLARHGTQWGGVVDLSTLADLAWPGTFSVARSLPPRPLLVMPRGVGLDGWEIL